MASPDDAHFIGTAVWIADGTDLVFHRDIRLTSRVVPVFPHELVVETCSRAGTCLVAAVAATNWNSIRRGELNGALQEILAAPTTDARLYRVATSEGVCKRLSTPVRVINVHVLVGWYTYVTRIGIDCTTHSRPQQYV